MNTKKITERIDNHTHIPKEKLNLYPTFPDAVKIEVTARCNSKCNFCAVSQGLREVGDMDSKFLHRILGELKELGVKEIGLFLLGESLMLPDIHEHIKYAKDLGFEYVFITTNGVAATPDKLKLMIDAGLDSLKFSVNAGTRERYKEMHGIDAFERVIEHIKWLHEYKLANNLNLKTALSSILVTEHEDEFVSFHNMIKEYVDETYFLPMYNLAGHMVAKQGQKFKRVSGNIGRIDNPSAPVPCWVLFNASKITWDGYLTACYSDHDEKFKLGDLNKKTVLECWYSKKAVDLRRQHLNDDFRYDSICAKCLGKADI